MVQSIWCPITPNNSKAEGLTQNVSLHNLKTLNDPECQPAQPQDPKCQTAQFHDPTQKQ